MSKTILAEHFTEGELRMILKLKSEHVQKFMTQERAEITLKQLRLLKPSFEKHVPRLLQPKFSKRRLSRYPIPIDAHKLAIHLLDIERGLVAVWYGERRARFHLQSRNEFTSKSILQDLFWFADLVDPGRERKSPYYREFTWEHVNKKARMQIKKLKRIFGDKYEEYRALALVERRTPEEIYGESPVKILTDETKLVKNGTKRVKHEGGPYSFYRLLDSIDWHYRIEEISEHVQKFTTLLGETLGWKINEELFWEEVEGVLPVDRSFEIVPTKNSLTIRFGGDMYSRASKNYKKGSPFLNKGKLYGHF